MQRTAHVILVRNTLLKRFSRTFLLMHALHKRHLLSAEGGVHLLRTSNLVTALIVIQNLPPALSTLTLFRCLRLHLQLFVVLTCGLQRNHRAHWKRCCKSTWRVLIRQKLQVQLHPFVAKSRLRYMPSHFKKVWGRVTGGLKPH